MKAVLLVCALFLWVATATVIMPSTAGTCAQPGHLLFCDVNYPAFLETGVTWGMLDRMAQQETIELWSENNCYQEYKRMVCAGFFRFCEVNGTDYIVHSPCKKMCQTYVSCTRASGKVPEDACDEDFSEPSEDMLETYQNVTFFSACVEDSDDSTHTTPSFELISLIVLLIISLFTL